MALEYADKNKGSSYRGDWDEPYVRFECGHESHDRKLVMRLYRRVKAGEGVGLCDECAKARRKKGAEESIIQSVAFAMEEGLRPLTGARGDVERAEKIRALFFQALHKEEEMMHHPFYTPQEQEEGRAVLEAVYSEAKAQTEAQRWIDAPDHDNPVKRVIDLCKEALSRLRKIEEGRFLLAECAHKGSKIPTGPRQKMFCESCREEGGHTLLQPQIVTPTEVLPDLEGTERQIVWAEKIRLSFYAELSSHESAHPGDKEKIEKLRKRMMKTIKKAKWWIESPSRENPKAHLKQLLKPPAKKK